ncbi:MAG: hypothetical protein ACRECO_15965 [Xanthobacteraceae bacterium]
MRRRPRSPEFLRGRVRELCVAAAFATALGGCVTNGDFGRVRPEFAREDIHDWLGRDAVASIGGLPSEFPLTDDERVLRDLAFALIELPYKRQRWDSVWREYGLGRRPAGVEPPFDRTAYLRKLHKIDRRSEASAYAQIVTDARNDVDRLGPFFTVARRVIDMDGKRAKSLVHISVVSDGERLDAHLRNVENKAIVAWVCRALKQRTVSYRFALERLVIAVPSRAAAEADRTIGLLHRNLGQYCGARGAVVAVRG